MHCILKLGKFERLARPFKPLCFVVPAVYCLCVSYSPLSLSGLGAGAKPTMVSTLLRFAGFEGWLSTLLLCTR
jgi:hypothetical protein